MQFLKPSNKQLEAMIALTPGAAGLVDAKGRVLYLNTTLLGYPLQSVSGRSILEGALPEDLPAAQEQFQLCLNSPDVPVSIQVRKNHVDGSVHVIEGIILNKLADPEIESIISYYRDVTSAKAHEDRESAQRRFLAEVSAVLSESLEYEATAEKVMTLALGTLGDWCSLELLADDGSIERSTMAHSDPKMVERVQALRKQRPSKPDPRFALARVIATGAPVFAAHITPEMIATASLDEETRNLINDLDIRSFIAVPLKARGRVLGALSVARCGGNPDYDNHDLAFISDVAHRMALHVDNARLYRLAQHGQQRSEILAEITALLSESLDSSNTLQQLARSTVEHFSDYCVVYRLEPDGRIYRAAGAHKDPAQASMMDQLLGLAIEPDIADTLKNVIKSGESVLTQDIGQNRLDERPEGTYKETMQKLGPKSSIMSPLIARGHRLGVIALALTETGRRYTPQDLKFVEELARRAAIAIDNERLYREIQDASRMKDQFLATLSHELRTPLTAISGWASVLKKTSDPAILQKATDSIQRNVVLQANLVDDLLDISRIVNGKMRLEVRKVNLPDLMGTAVENMRAAADAKSIQLTLNIEKPVQPVACDAERVQQIVWNLISNAIKFTPAKGSVRVELRPRPEDEATEIVVTDSGIGISADFLPHVFDRFRQFDSTNTRSVSGLGLGLSIVKHLTELHGGIVIAASDGPGKGASFSVILPASSAAV